YPETSRACAVGLLHLLDRDGGLRIADERLQTRRSTGLGQGALSAHALALTRQERFLSSPCIAARSELPMAPCRPPIGSVPWIDRRGLPRNEAVASLLAHGPRPGRERGAAPRARGSLAARHQHHGSRRPAGVLQPEMRG